MSTFRIINKTTNELLPETFKDEDSAKVFLVLQDISVMHLLKVTKIVELTDADFITKKKNRNSSKVSKSERTKTSSRKDIGTFKIPQTGFLIFGPYYAGLECLNKERMTQNV